MFGDLATTGLLTLAGSGTVYVMIRLILTERTKEYREKHMLVDERTRVLDSRVKALETEVKAMRPPKKDES